MPVTASSGGFLITPLLIFLGVPPPVAVATGANEIVASSMSGLLAHWRRKTVDIKMGAVLSSNIPALAKRTARAYPVGKEVTVYYDYTGAHRDAGGTATGHASPENQVQAPVQIVRCSKMVFDATPLSSQ